MRVDDISHAIEAAEKCHFRLVLVVGLPRSGKTAAMQVLSNELDVPVTNVNLELSKALLELTHRQRPIKVQKVFAQLLEEKGAQPVLLDNIELLFSAELQLDPLRVLQRVARNQTIIAVWPGIFEDEVLTYAEPGHPEARRYSRPESIIVLATALQTSSADRSSFKTAGDAEESE